jgi:transcriptional regulator GlxA family with amidase domain
VIESVISLLQDCDIQSVWRNIISVCTGAFVLVQAGLLNGKQVTTHWEDIPEMRALFPEIEVGDSVRWIDNGEIVTSAGISAGIDMSLHLVGRLEVEELAMRTARQMEFDQ